MFRTPSQVDLTINNDIAFRNTMLLAAYASMPYVRELGLLIKRCTKGRSLIDPKMGYLSSYAFMLLVVFFCQRKGLIPNLQDPAVNARMKKFHET